MSAMAIEVELGGNLLPGAARRQVLQAEREMTVREVARRIGLDPQVIGLVVVNGVQSELEDPVPSRSRVCFYPPMTGG